MVRPKVSREQLLCWLDAISLAVYDTALFLDTHPEDQEALNYYHENNKLRKQLLNEYSEMFGPLTMDKVDDTNRWTWVDHPWPWEGGC